MATSEPRLSTLFAAKVNMLIIMSLESSYFLKY